MRRLLPLSLFSALIFAGCGEKEDTGFEPPDTGPDTEDTGPDLGDMPDDPAPFEITISGTDNETIVFDSPTCYYPVGSSNLRVFWRSGSGAHAWVLLAELLGDFEGPGTYDASNAAPRAKLQEEAGGEGRYYQAEATLGDTVSITVEQLEEDRAWGEYEVSGMHDTEGGSITLSPMPVPIWCPALN